MDETRERAAVAHDAAAGWTENAVVALATAGARNAVAWAAAEAERRGLPLVVALPAGTDDPGPEAAGVAPVRIARIGSSVVRELLGLARGAALLVLPDADLAASVLTVAGCPVAVVPCGPRPSGPVFVGVGPETDVAVPAAAAAIAADRRVPLWAVRAWSDLQVTLGRVRPENLARWTVAERPVQAELERVLEPVRRAYPQVDLRPLVVRDDAALLLAALSTGGQLLVVGAPARGGSPVDRLLRTTRCPVLVVGRRVPAEHEGRRRRIPSPPDPVVAFGAGPSTGSGASPVPGVCGGGSTAPSAPPASRTRA